MGLWSYQIRERENTQEIVGRLECTLMISIVADLNAVPLPPPFRLSSPLDLTSPLTFIVVHIPFVPLPDLYSSAFTQGVVLVFCPRPSRLPHFSWILFISLFLTLAQIALSKTPCNDVHTRRCSRL